MNQYSEEEEKNWKRLYGGVPARKIKDIENDII